jgi:Subtilase family
MKPTVVQFTVNLTAPDLTRLRTEHDLKLDRCVPDLGYIERLSPASVQRVESDFLVRACLPLDPHLKLSPSIRGQQATPASPLEFSAVLFDDADPSAVEAVLVAAGAREVHIVDDRPIAARLQVRFMLDDLARIDEIAANDDLIWIEPIFPILTTNVDAAETIQSGFWGSSPIWDNGLHGEGQVINVIDKGILDIAHCLFKDIPLIAVGQHHRKVVHIFNDTGGPVRKHPTMVCGAAAGDEFGNSGAHQYRGGAWSAKLICSNSNDLYKPRSISMSKMLDRARKQGAAIHSNSWTLTATAASLPGTRIGLYNNLARDIDGFSWADEDQLVVAAGGNTGDPNTPPGTAKNTLCVAAAKNFPDEMSRATGVDGPTPDGRRKPEIMAVGWKIQLANPGTPCGFAVDSGTSFATPHVVAAAALVRQYFLEGFYPAGKRQAKSSVRPTGALIKAVLLNSTVDMTGEPGYPSNAEGWGLVRLNRALYFDAGPRRLSVKDVRMVAGLDVRSREKRTYSLFVNDSTEQLKITLVWMDPPPSEPAYNQPSRNTIELTATADADPLYASYVGNDVDVNTGLSNPSSTGPVDALNNVQMIIVDNPPIGSWKITVRGDTNSGDFFNDRQGFALVASGGLDMLGFP